MEFCPYKDIATQYRLLPKWSWWMYSETRITQGRGGGRRGAPPLGICGAPQAAGPQQCDQIQKIGWECKLNGENLYILPKLKLHPCHSFSPSNHWPSSNCISFKGINEKSGYKNLCYPLFFPDVHMTCLSWIKMISDSITTRYGWHDRTYHFLFKDQHLNFSYILYPSDETFFPTSHPITEHEFGHTSPQSNGLREPTSSEA